MSTCKTFKSLHLRYQSVRGIRNKVQSADLLEALLGAAYVSGRVELGFRTLPRLGILLPEQAADLSMIHEQAARYIKVVETALSQPNMLTLTMERQKELEDKLQYHFHHPLLLSSLAMRHPSLQQGGGSSWSYQRLEFLGDAVLDLVVVSTLFKMHPTWQGGELSQGKVVQMTNNEFLRHEVIKLELIELLLRNSLTVTTLREEMRSLAEEPAINQPLLPSPSIDPVAAMVITTLSTAPAKEEVVEGEDDATIVAKAEKIAACEEHEVKKKESLAVKINADLLESVIGAVIIDSYGDINVVIGMLEHVGYMEIIRNVMV